MTPRPQFIRPGRALAIALGGVAVVAAVVVALRAAPVDGTMGWTVVAGVVTLLPMVAAAALAGRLAGRSSAPPRSVALSVLIGVCSGAIARAAVEFVVRSPSQRGLEVALADVVLAVIVGVVLSPLAEELLFRGTLQAALRDLLRARGRSATATVLAVAGASVCFALLHVVASGFAPSSFFGPLVLGVAAGIIDTRGHGLAGAVAAHSVYNGLGLIAALA